MNRAWSSLFVILLTAAVMIVPCVNHELWIPDEVREAQIGHELGRSGSLLVPSLSSEPFVEKPPLFYGWIHACFELAGGRSAALARVPSMLAALGTFLFVYLLGRRMFDRRSAWCCAFVMLLSYEWLRIAHYVVSDLGLAFAVAGACWSMHALLYAESARARRFGALGYYLFSAVGFWCKGFVGLAFPCVALIAAIFFERRWWEPFHWRHLLGILFLFGNIGAWVLALQRFDATGAVAETWLLGNQLDRFFPNADYALGHVTANPWYYTRVLPIQLLPWTPALAHVAAFHWRRRCAARATWYPLYWFVPGFLLLSLAGTKRSLYLLPMIAPACVLIGPWVGEVTRGIETRWHARPLMYASAALCTLLGCACCLASLFLGEGLTLTGVFTLLLIIVVSLRAVAALRSEAWDVVPVRCTTVALAIALAILANILPILEEKKSARNFAETLREQVPADAQLLLYRPDEALRAFVPFHTGRYPSFVHEYSSLPSKIGDVPTYLATIIRPYGELEARYTPGYHGPLAFILGDGKREERVTAAGVTPTASVLAATRCGRRRCFVLLRIEPCHESRKQP